MQERRRCKHEAKNRQKPSEQSQELAKSHERSNNPINGIEEWQLLLWFLGI